eukprot:COSAG01_NODE_4159_length_5281_cov_23.903816_6_plen_79_part_00
MNGGLSGRSGGAQLQHRLWLTHGLQQTSRPQLHPGLRLTLRAVAELRAAAEQRAAAELRAAAEPKRKKKEGGQNHVKS